MENRNLEKFRSLHDEAYLYINQGITQEDPKIDRKDVALIMYQRGLGLLDMALCFDTEGDTPEHMKAQKMQEKMARSREHVNSRIIDITDILAPPIRSCDTAPARPPPPRPSTLPPNQSTRTDLPPSYSEVMHTDKGGRSQGTATNPQGQGAAAVAVSSQGGANPFATRYSKDQDRVRISTGIDPLSPTSSEEISSNMPRSTSWEEGVVVFSMPEVQIFYISAIGEVSTPSYPETLHIVKFSRRGENRDLPPAFIELGNFTYPLVPGQSAILKSDYGGYILPDLERGEGASIGMILPESSDQRQREKLDDLLAKLTKSSQHDVSFKTQAEVDDEYREYKEFSGAFAEGIVKGAEIVGKGMVKGAVKTSELLFRGTDYAKQYVTPVQAGNIDPRVMKGLEIAHTVSSGACRVSGFLVSKIGVATMKLGRLAAPHLEKQATKALTHFSGQSRTESNNQLKIAGEIASGTLAAVSTLYIALENSSKILAKNMANNTVMIVAHKYGTDAAAVTNNALATAGNSYLTFYNAAAMGPKGIAKRVAKDTGKAMIGFDPEEVNSRASRAPDSNINVSEALESLRSGKQDDNNKENQNGEMTKDSNHVNLSKKKSKNYVRKPMKSADGAKKTADPSSSRAKPCSQTSSLGIAKACSQASLLGKANAIVKDVSSKRPKRLQPDGKKPSNSTSSLGIDKHSKKQAKPTTKTKQNNRASSSSKAKSSTKENTAKPSSKSRQESKPKLSSQASSLSKAKLDSKASSLNTAKPVSKVDKLDNVKYIKEERSEKSSTNEVKRKKVAIKREN